MTSIGDERHGDTSTRTENYWDAVIVGAGFGGLYMLYKLREFGLRALVLETGDDVGGTWYWNRYPGARCDVESVVYSFSFAPELDAEWRWSERFATQPEILDYLRFVADRLDLRRDISFNTRVESARFETNQKRWRITTERGCQITCKYCIMATGPLSASRLPDIDGIDTFAGERYHTGQWPTDRVEFNGKRVGVIGTGSSGIQTIPVIAEDALELTVFMRTPNFSVPAKNGPLDNERYAEWLSGKDEIRARIRKGEIGGSGDCFMAEELRSTRTRPAADFSTDEQRDILQRRWDAGGALLPGAFADVMLDEQVNKIVACFVREKIAEIVEDSETAANLSPSGYPFGAKRLCVDTDFYETFNRANVTLVDLKEDPIERITTTGIQTATGEFVLDTIVFATGFDAMTGALSRIDINTDTGSSLAEVWEDGPVNYLGIGVADLPNLFLIGGPGSPSVLSNVVLSNEQHVDFIGDLIAHMETSGVATVTPTQKAQADWVAHVNEVASATLFTKANSWYLGANIPGKPRVFLPYAGGVARYRARCDQVALSDYEGFEFDDG